MNQIELIDYRLIFEDENNPRKTFNKESLNELAENIKAQGLLQPITVRPYPTMKIEAPKYLNSKPCYKIVMGARRWKACIMAGFSEVPCIVREMTDSEAFDAMITENLQRKDVEPMEEARAFYSLHERGVTYEELASRFGKSEVFVRLRIKLNDLITEFVDMLDKKELQLSHAQELCKLNPDYQRELFEKKYTDKVENYYNWKDKPVKEIRCYLENDFRDLETIDFDKSECINCENRCSVNALFSEYSANKCTKPTCFDDKKFLHRLAIAVQKADEGYVLVKRELYKGQTPDAVVVELEKRGYTLLENNYKTFNWENAAEYPERDEDDTDEEWEEALQKYETELAEQNTNIENGSYKKAWFVGFWSKDEFCIIKFKDASTDSTDQVASSNELQSLKEKLNRQSQIKEENTIADLRKLLSEDTFYTNLEDQVMEIEKVAIVAMMIKHAGYQFKREIEKTFDPERTPIENIQTLMGTPLHTKIIRTFIKENITDAGVTFEKGTQSVLKSICDKVLPEESARIQLKYAEVYLRRKEKLDQQIKELEA